ncbi:aminotransferase A [Caloramator sp. E03]|uniref:aminotransferase A n=1 Tax=Caloramator sp. E03 TaxID=2576307 RepID=UPI00110FFBEF|nr:aminotransferase A [Caloramator sp. E03]QCX32953.1 aminotransferase A [Caloramator sp. E03]
MEHLINKRVKEIEISGIRKFYNLVSQYKDTISLTIGQPDFPTPQHIKDSTKLALDNNKTAYTHNAGLLELRTAAKKFISKYNLYYDEDEIIVTNGASEAIDTSLRTILEEGCEVILPGPVYPGYEPIIRLCGAKPVYVDVRDSSFKLTANKIKEKLTSNTRCIILPYPSNPTGVVLSKDELYDIAQLIKDKDIFILSDEIYSELVYDYPHNSIASIDFIKNKAIVINGLSKSHSMTGFRIGFIFAPSYITKHAIKVHQYNSTCACTISQYAALEALTNGADDSLVMKLEYKKRRDYVYERLIKMGFEVEKPNGAFYIFPSISKFGMSSFDFALKLLESKKVAVVPGSAFSIYGEGFIRISYAYSMDVLEDGLNRIEQFVKSL